MERLFLMKGRLVFRPVERKLMKESFFVVACIKSISKYPKNDKVRKSSCFLILFGRANIGIFPGRQTAQKSTLEASDGSRSIYLGFAASLVIHILIKVMKMMGSNLFQCARKLFPWLSLAALLAAEFPTKKGRDFNFIFNENCKFYAEIVKLPALYFNGFREQQIRIRWHIRGFSPWKMFEKEATGAEGNVVFYFLMLLPRTPPTWMVLFWGFPFVDGVELQVHELEWSWDFCTCFGSLCAEGNVDESPSAFDEMSAKNAINQRCLIRRIW